MALQIIDPGGLDIFSSNPAQHSPFGVMSDVSLVGLSSSAPAGRYNTHAYSSSVGGSFFGYWFNNFQELIFGLAYYNPFTTFVNGQRFMEFKDGSTNQCDVATDGTGHFFFRRNGTSISGSSTNALAVGWYYIELHAKIAGGTSGSMELKVTPLGGVQSTWLSVTGVNTQATGNAFANRCYTVGLNNGFQYWKDLYVLDTGTGINKTYLGDSKVITLYSNAADGTFQQWTPNTGTQVAAVQDGKSQTGTWPDGDTTYISDTTAGHISAFQMDSTSLNGIYAVSHITNAKTPSAGSIAQVLVQSGSVVETSATQTLTTSYLFYVDIQEQNPNGSVAWTSSAVNATYPGPKLVSGSARVTQELLLVIASTVAAATTKPSQLWIIT